MALILVSPIKEPMFLREMTNSRTGAGHIYKMSMEHLVRKYACGCAPTHTKKNVGISQRDAGAN